MVKYMVMFYFSGTGNSKYVAELFAGEMGAKCHSIEESIDFETLIDTNEVIAFSYPVYMSRVPRIMRKFVERHKSRFKNKKIIIFCTQLLLSGDGARAFAAMFPKDYINLIYAEHFFMPNNVSNVFILPMTSEKKVERCLVTARRKMQSVCNDIRNGRIKKRGFNVFSRGLGLIQGVFLSAVEKKANNYVGITSDCTNCRLCVSSCPTGNLIYENGRITHKHDCTMCYRCINTCPAKAITIVFPGKVKKQYILNAK